MENNDKVSRRQMGGLRSSKRTTNRLIGVGLLIFAALVFLLLYWGLA